MKCISAISVLFLLGGVAACSRSSADAAPRSEIPSVAVAPVTRGDLSQVLTIAAEFRPYQEIDVHAKVAGYLQTITVDVGDHVKAGQLLAVLEIPELRNQLQEDEASIARATEEINRAKADLGRTESAHEVAHLAAQRLAAASKERPKLIAQQDLDEATGRDHEAEARVTTANASLAAARGQLDFAKANKEKTQTLLGYARITAPFTGVITRRYADKGAMIQAGTSSQTQTMPVVRLSEVDTLRLSIAVPESVVPLIHTKEPVSVHVQAIGRSFTGGVSRFADRLDQDTRTMLVEVDVPNPTGELVPGMNADVGIALKALKSALTVPIDAVDRTTEEARLFVVDQSHQVEPRPVHVDLETAGRAAVSGQIAAGDLVVVGSRDQLKPGTVVRPRAVARAEGEK